MQIVSHDFVMRGKLLEFDTKMLHTHTHAINLCGLKNIDHLMSYVLFKRQFEMIRFYHVLLLIFINFD